MWALDLGTTNSCLARWDEEEGRPRLVRLPAICRGARAEPDPLGTARLVPSAVEVTPCGRSLWQRLGRAPVLVRNTFWGRWGWIGRAALERNEGRWRQGFVPGFKRELGRDPLRTLVRCGGQNLGARDVARLYLRELLAALKATTGERPRELVVTTPVSSFETYRAELRMLLEGLGVSSVRFLDEPIAAALGYGLALRHRRRVLVVDFGGGTLDVALVELAARGVEAGSCTVLAKAGRALGGDTVDRWLVEAFCASRDYALRDEADDELRFWYRLMVDAARRLKEALYLAPSATLDLVPPEELRRFEARLLGEGEAFEVRRESLEALLEARGLYRELDGAVAQVLCDAGRHGVGADDIDDVLLVGGSTLLPGVYGRFEARFGRDRVRAWQPFEAVAYGAARFAARQLSPSDYIVHDYALLTHDGLDHRERYTVVVPRGTRFPTAPDFWKRQLVPTCSMGEAETWFKLVVCEIGEAREERVFGWDGAGRLHAIAARGPSLIVPLNDANPTLGRLDPPHAPHDRGARLEVSFGINAERWLCATVRDLRTDRALMIEEPVVRLL